MLGNPNTGKSTLFNALTGSRQRVGNYPGVTVERKVGQLRPLAERATSSKQRHPGSKRAQDQRGAARTSPLGSATVDLVDLPGTYSLAARSLDEQIVVDVLTGRTAAEEPIDAVLLVVDASNIERNLYLATQVLEIGLPTVIVLTMMDLADRKGIEIDIDRLSARLGVTVLPLNPNSGAGVPELQQALVRLAGAERRARRRAPTDAVSELEPIGSSPTRATALGVPPRPNIEYPPVFRNAVQDLRRELSGMKGVDVPGFAESIRLLVDEGGVAEQRLSTRHAEAAACVRGLRETRRSSQTFILQESLARYAWIREVVAECVHRYAISKGGAATETIDRVLTHRVWGVLALLVVMAVLFQSVFAFATPLMDGIDALVGKLGDLARTGLGDGVLGSLVVDGIIAGVGGVVIFLPQIAILFLLISVLEESGYLARASFLLDRLFARVGLSGRSFIPLLSSFACAVPGIMATRVIEDRRTRLATICLAPLMSCSARLPVYTVLIGAVVPSVVILGVFGSQALTMLAMYALGIALAWPLAWVFRRILFRGPASPFLIELPPYRVPRWRSVGRTVWERSWAFLVRAGTVIFAISVVVWATNYFPHPKSIHETYEARRAELGAGSADLDELEPRLAETAEQPTDGVTGGAVGASSGAVGAASEAVGESVADQLAALDAEEAAEYQRQSILGRAGHWIEPLVRPLGWDWRIGSAALASFPAREVVVSTLGVIFSVGDPEEESSLRAGILEARRADGSPLFNLPTALSLMVFFALCAQCAATLAVIRRETNSWRWPVFVFSYMTVLAYVGAFATYRIATWLGGPA